METLQNMSPAAQLLEVDQAIKTILTGGQSYKIGSRSLTRADLNALRSLRKELQAEAEASCGNPNLVANGSVAYFDRR